MTIGELQDAVKILTEQALQNHEEINKLKDVVHAMNGVFIEIQKILNNGK